MTDLAPKLAATQHLDENCEIADRATASPAGSIHLPESEIVDTGRIRLGGGYRLPVT
jgi:hypothetical protein